MKTRYTTIIILLAFISSCGPSAEEQAATQKHRDDSIAVSVQQRLQAKMDIQSRIAQVKNAITNLNADLAAAKDRMIQIQDFHFLRTNSEREEQVKNQSIKIQRIEEKIEKLNDDLSSSENTLASYQ